MARKSLTAKQLFAKNLRRIVESDGRSEAEIGEALGMSDRSPAHAASNLRKYLSGARWPGDKMFDRMASALGVARAEFFSEDG